MRRHSCGVLVLCLWQLVGTALFYFSLPFDRYEILLLFSVVWLGSIYSFRGWQSPSIESKSRVFSFLYSLWEYAFVFANLAILIVGFFSNPNAGFLMAAILGLGYFLNPIFNGPWRAEQAQGGTKGGTP